MPSSETVLPIPKCARLERKLPCQGQVLSSWDARGLEHAFIGNKSTKYAMPGLGQNRHWRGKARDPTRAKRLDMLSTGQLRDACSHSAMYTSGEQPIMGGPRCDHACIFEEQKESSHGSVKGPGMLILHRLERKLKWEGEGPSMPPFKHFPTSCNGRVS